MAAYTASTAKSYTLTANTADTVTLTGTGTFLRVAQSSSTAIYFTAVPTGSTPTTATVTGDNMIAVINSTQPVTIGWPGTGAVISIITSGSLGSVNIVLHN